LNITGPLINDKIMENKPTSLEELFEKVREYADIRIDLFKLKSINKVSGFTSSVLTGLILLIILSIVLLCITIGLALLIGWWIGITYLGFFIVGGIYLIIGLVLYSQRRKFFRIPISNSLIKKLID
jgi:Putative Actinobacterial Holin-X, holin superfamily III